eukprot:6608310-Prymnesium_polylepis.1
MPARRTVGGVALARADTHLVVEAHRVGARPRALVLTVAVAARLLRPGGGLGQALCGLLVGIANATRPAPVHDLLSVGEVAAAYEREVGLARRPDVEGFGLAEHGAGQCRGRCAASGEGDEQRRSSCPSLGRGRNGLFSHARETTAAYLDPTS